MGLERAGRLDRADARAAKAARGQGQQATPLGYGLEGSPSPITTHILFAAASMRSGYILPGFLDVPSQHGRVVHCSCLHNTGQNCGCNEDLGQLGWVNGQDPYGDPIIVLLATIRGRGRTSVS